MSYSNRIRTLQNHTVRQGAAFLRITQIIGDPKADPPIQPLIPVSKSTWWKWVQDGKAPASVKLSERVTAWRAGDVQSFIETFNACNEERQ